MTDLKDKRLIVREKPKTNYTKLKNSTLRHSIKGNKLNTFQVWIYCLSCRFDYEITCDLIAKRFKVSRRTASKHLSLLAENRLAEAIPIRSEDGRFKKHYYKIYEKPIGLEREGDRYKHALKDPRWQKKRLEIFQRDDWQCQKCGDKKSMLAVHHESYIEGFEPWEYPSAMLTTLCEECHIKVHDPE